MSIQSSSISLVGKQVSECGYCHNKLSCTSKSYGIIANVLTVHDYEELMLRGWRRSGTYAYKPTMYDTCCPAYTIRLKASNFAPSKKHKQLYRRIDRYLATGDIHATVPDSKGQANSVNNKKRGNKSTTQEAIVEPIASAVHTLTVETVEASYTTEKYLLYRRYQLEIHRDESDDVTEKGFKRFLVESPLQYQCSTSSTSSTSSCTVTYKYGTYHQLYRLDGKELIAVGVIDILPSGLSSVYLFYHPDYRFLELGKYTALKELEFCQEHSLQYYYMGFYIYSCMKMRYKGDYSPSELMCPTTMTWYSLDNYCIPLLNKHLFTPFHPDSVREREMLLISSSYSDDGSSSMGVQVSQLMNAFSPRATGCSVNEILLDVAIGEYIHLTDLKSTHVSYLQEVLEAWMHLAGATAARNIVVKLA